MQSFIKEQYRKLKVIQGAVLEFAVMCNDCPIVAACLINRLNLLLILIISNNQYSKFNLPFVTDIRGQILELSNQSTG